MEQVSSKDFKGLESRYRFGDKIFETFFTIGFAATEISSSTDLIIVVYRYLLDPHSQFVNKFSGRQKKISEATSSFDPQYYGVTLNGVAYIALPRIDGRRLSEIKGLGAEAENVFRKVVSIVKDIHLADVALGDLSEDSFIVDSDNNVYFLGSFGAILDRVITVSEAVGHYLSPEQLSAERFDVKSDVFSLGVIGYRLFTDHHVSEFSAKATTYNPSKSAPAPSTFDSQIPSWLDPLIGSCLELDRRNRYASAVKLAEAIEEGVVSGFITGGTNPWLPYALVVQEGAQSSDVQEAPEKELKSGSNVKSMVLLILLVIVVSTLLLQFSSPKEGINIPGDDWLASLVEIAPDGLKSQLQQLEGEELTADAIIQLLEEASRHRGPVSLALLGAVVRGDIKVPHADSDRIVSFAIDKITERMKDEGFRRSAELWREWFFSAEKKEIFSRHGLFDSSIIVLDAQRESKGRRSAMQRIYTLDPELAANMATALVLDDQNDDAAEFRPLARIFLQSRAIPNSKGKSFEELLVAFAKRAPVLSADIPAVLERLGDEQLLWSLNAIMLQGSGVPFEIVDEIIKRDLFQSYAKVFFETLSEEKRAFLPEKLITALIAAALGDLSLNTLQNLAQWGGETFDRVFLSFVALSKDEPTANKAIEILLQRSVAAEPTKTLLSWLGKQPQESRYELARAVSIISLSELASQEELAYAFNAILSRGGGRDLFRSSLTSSNQTLLREVVDRVGPIIAYDELIPLLRHEDPEIRISVVRILKETNSVTILNEVVRGYEQEKDPDVKAVYEAEHWTVRERM